VNSKQSKAGAWWFVILEKAFAKENNNYAAMHLGGGTESFRALTGMPVSSYTTAKQDLATLFKVINDADKNQWAMTASC